MRLSPLLASRLLGLLLGCACGPVHAQSFDDVRLSTEVFATDLGLPTGLAFLGPGDVLVTEKGGGVKRVLEGQPPTLVRSFPVDFESTRGLLGIAINSSEPPDVFLYRTEDLEGVPRNRVHRYVWSGSDLIDEQLVLDLPATPGPNHNGGVLLLGPPGQTQGPGDGALLYTAIGDLNRFGQLQNRSNGGRPDDTGVVLRIQQDGSPAPGNPLRSYCENPPSPSCATDADCAAFGGMCITAVEKYFAYGVRNSFGLALDPTTGILWATENGPSSYDEINRIDPGMNSGWSVLMGPDARDLDDQEDLHRIPGSHYSDPEFAWLDTVAPTSIVFPVGSSLGLAYDPVALVGDSNTGQIYRFRLNWNRTDLDLSGLPGLEDRVADTDEERDLLAIAAGFGIVTGLRVGPDGHLYVLSLSDGVLYRVRGPDPVPSVPAAVLALLGTLVLGVLVRGAGRQARLRNAARARA